MGCQMSVGLQEEEMLQYCAQQGITFEAYAALRGCPFSDPKAQSIASAHGVGVSQVCVRWMIQKGATMSLGLGVNTTKMPSYAKGDLDVYGFELSDSEMATLGALGKQIDSCAQGI